MTAEKWGLKMNKPFLINEKYPIGDIPIAIINFADYMAVENGPAVNNGIENAAPLLQQAINDCAALGGGVIYIPEGRYLLEDNIELKTAVFLRGEWICPQEEKNTGKGTILLCRFGKNEPEGIPQITMCSCSGIKNMTFFYPDQNIKNPIKYSPTLRQKGSDSVTLENCTLINPWLGMQCGPDGNELHYLKNVYISPLYIGFFMDMTTDIGRMENLNISPIYSENFSQDNEELSEADKVYLRNYMLKNTIGVYMARSDWEYGYGINIEGCSIGFLITSFKDSGPNTQLSSLKIKNCNIGMKFVNVNPYGVALSDSVIYSDIPGLEAAIECESSFKTLVQLCGVDLYGPYKYLVMHNGEGELSLYDCHLSGWAEDGAAIKQTNGGLSVIQCTFSKNGNHIILDDGIKGALILGNNFCGEAKIITTDASKQELLYSTDNQMLPKIPRGGHKKREKAAIPNSKNIAFICDFGAVADGKTDNTKAIQAAIDSLGEAGGTVYIPGGWFFCEGNLYVKKGIELRGVYEEPSHTLGGGSVLLTTTGKEDETAEPFINLYEGAGIRGIVIYHPEQNPSNPINYPWAVRSYGINCYAVNSVLVNPWLGVDFATNVSDGHYISYISGAPIKCGVSLGNNHGEGWVENIQYNPHYWFRTNLPNHPTNSTWKDFWHKQIENLDALKFGYNENEHLYGTFVFAAKHGLYFVLQDGKGTNGKFIGHGTDGGEIGLCIEGVGDIDLINNELVSIESPRTRIYLLVKENASGKARLFNNLLWGNPDYAVSICGGDTDIIQSNYQSQGKIANVITGGKSLFAGCWFYKNTENFKITGGEVQLIGTMAARRAQKRSECFPMLDIEKDGNSTAINEKFSWSK